MVIVAKFFEFFQKYRIYIISSVIVLIGLIYGCWLRVPGGASADGASFAADATSCPTASAVVSENVKGQEILFHIDGAVKIAGVYRVVTANLYVYEALQLAGGPAAGADLSKVNLAAEVKTGQKISIPLLTPRSTSIQVSGRSVGAGNLSDTPEVININQATLADLRKIKGVGPVMAQKILDYREKNGYFTSTEQLKKVGGIGEKTFKRWENLISI